MDVAAATVIFLLAAFQAVNAEVSGECAIGDVTHLTKIAGFLYVPCGDHYDYEYYDYFKFYQGGEDPDACNTWVAAPSSAIENLRPGSETPFQFTSDNGLVGWDMSRNMSGLEIDITVSIGLTITSVKLIGASSGIQGYSIGSAKADFETFVRPFRNPVSIPTYSYGDTAVIDGEARTVFIRPIPHAIAGETLHIETYAPCNLLCREGWVYFQGKCYLFDIGAGDLNFWESYQSCSLKEPLGKSNLLTVGNADVMTFIRDSIYNTDLKGNTRFWTAATDVIDDGTWVTVPDLQPLVYAQWGTNEPNDLKGNEMCANLLALRGYEMNDATCKRPGIPICESLAGDLDLTYEGPSDEGFTACPAEWLPLGALRKCVRIMQEPVNWFEAFNVCLHQFPGQSTSLTITTQQEMDAVVDILSVESVQSYIWTAGHAMVKPNKWYYAPSGKRLKSSQLFWAPSEPSLSNSRRCLRLDSSFGHLMTSANCGDSGIPVCEINL